MTTMADRPVIEFPCRFPIKAMGSDETALRAALEAIIEAHVPAADRRGYRARQSRAGHFVSITVTIIATSQEQLDAIYRALSAHEQVLMAL